MFIFGLCSTSDDWPSNPSKKHQHKKTKKAPKSSKNKMFIFGLPTSDDQPSDPSKEHRKWTENNKGPLGLLKPSSQAKTSIKP